MKVVGEVKKQPRTWCLAITAAGNLNIGYTGYCPSKLDRAPVEAIKATEDAREFMKLNPKAPEQRKPPKFYSAHDKSISDEDRADTEAWNVNQRAISVWNEAKQLAEWTVYPKLPIFEADLIFSGYSKGQSSFTLDFVLPESGQLISFGPKNIGELIEALIQERSVKRIDMTGKLGAPYNNFDKRDKDGRCIPQRDPYTGMGLRMKFTFTKQGKNIYAQLVED
ncbi:hypothetical protein hairong_104 [Pseudomonas phage hairong]|nr:hypothetical protein hairong_104 [Pseudomonas phage hairong]